MGKWKWIILLKPGNEWSEMNCLNITDNVNTINNTTIIKFNCHPIFLHVIRLKIVKPDNKLKLGLIWVFLTWGKKQALSGPCSHSCMGSGSSTSISIRSSPGISACFSISSLGTSVGMSSPGRRLWKQILLSYSHNRWPHNRWSHNRWPHNRWPHNKMSELVIRWFYTVLVSEDIFTARTILFTTGHCLLRRLIGNVPSSHSTCL